MDTGGGAVLERMMSYMCGTRAFIPVVGMTGGFQDYVRIISSCR